ncbi:uncharacterized protein HGUI_02841 [Hanseniaspora guilliermondii]|uniref:Uncharacterized protein n=1 Tax=Hanseniaspora guilliermondii TaxID=56406 RepID=A0A1L0CQA2_9ASCO|nr:uncharacterized protein HGUI_02841 [Hanseniaspora guilliermondii]
MPSNILNKISEKLTGHDDHEQHHSSNSYQNQQTSRASDDNDFGDYQSGSNSRTRDHTTGGNGLGDHQRGAFAETSKNSGNSWDHVNSNMNSDGYNTNGAGMRSNDMGDYGQSGNSYRDSVNSSKQQKPASSYNDDEYGSSRTQGSSGRGMKDNLQSAANNQYVQQGINKGKDYISNNL